ncbi:MAG: folylpolyglutamate synthase/dihydrofolate synthase family protein [Pseudomonadota bacterium]
MPCLHDLLKETCLLHYKEVDLGLERCLTLLKKLGNPHLRIPPVFHVAGTNGKGSTLAFIKQILQDNGYTIHRYTSPHLVHFNERIELCGIPATNEVLADALTELLRINNGAPITTFEVTTCLAFMLFAQTPADFTLLEVGVGGRLDATNVIQQPLVSGITSISLDHQSDLGETVEAIAFEKAGIIKAGTPIIVASDLFPSVHAVIERSAQEQGASLFVASTTISPYLGLTGEHQHINAGLAVQMIVSAGINCRDINASLKKTKWPGRLQCLALSHGDLWLDGAHNEAGAKALAMSLQRLEARPWTFFIHIKARKDANAMLKHFATVAQAFYFVNFPIEGGEGVPASELLRLSAELGIRSTLLSTMDDMFNIMGKTESPLVASGSLFWVGRVLTYIV